MQHTVTLLSEIQNLNSNMQRLFDPANVIYDDTNKHFSGWPYRYEHWMLLHYDWCPGISASFFAETSIRSPRKLLFPLSKKILSGWNYPKKIILVWKRKHCLGCVALGLSGKLSSVAEARQFIWTCSRNNIRGFVGLNWSLPYQDHWQQNCTSTWCKILIGGYDIKPLHSK